MRRLVLIAPVLFLAACSKGGDGTNFSINAKTDDGSPVTAQANGQSGQVSIDTPVFKADVKLPKFALDSAHMDLDGVKLFPGSKVEGVNVEGGENKDGSVRISFDAPADTGQVHGWFQKQMSDAGYTAKAEGNGFTGTTDEGNPFTLELQGAGGHTKGVMHLQGKE